MFTKATVSTIQEDIKIALEAVAKKHNLSMSGTRINYTDATFKLAVQFASKDAVGGDFNPVYIKDLDRLGWQFGLTRDMLDKQIRLSKGVMKFQGMRGKYAILKDAEGKMWKYDPMLVVGLLKA